jgi:ribonucleoside-diphosphate reductase alpha chain/ribonucleoside-triphosphate reductase
MTDNLFISDADVAKAEAEIGVPKFGPLGDVVDSRTYRRFLQNEKRRETFFERNARTTNYSVSLALGMQNTNELQEEADLLYSYMNQLKVWPSGRTQWVGGTSCTEKRPEANFNCSFSAINRPSVFSDAAELLMLGIGFGFRVHKKDIEQLPKIRKGEFLVSYDPYNPVAKKDRQEETSITYEYLEDENQSSVCRITIGDSKTGWTSGIQYLIDIYFGLEEVPNYIIFNFDSVRPLGERIQGFGGTASGPQALEGILKDIVDIFEECPTDKLRSVDCVDIVCCEARGIIAGSSRRSALIGLGEEDDLLFRNCKLGLYTNPELAKKSYRSQANNTVTIGSQHESLVKQFACDNADLHIQHPKVLAFLQSLAPSKETLQKMFESVKTEGEPGFDNWPRMQLLRFYAARKERPQYSNEEIWERYCDCGTNPCHEILLNTGTTDSYQVSFCNLTSVPLINHLYVKDGNYYVDYETLEVAIRLASRIGLRQTCVEMAEKHLSQTQLEERLLGVSFTGLRDLMDAMSWETEGEEIKSFLSNLKAWANDEATKYAEKLGVPRPLLVTCTKPEGSFSKIVGASNGLHWDWSPYYIQRIRMSGADALAKTLRTQGIPATPEVYDLEKLFPKLDDVWKRIDAFKSLDYDSKQKLLSEANTIVFEFPVKSVSKTSQAGASVKEQLQNIDNVTRHYVDHMSSNTITVTNDDWDVCVNWIVDNWANYTTASFLPYYAGGDYPLLPFEQITEEQYQMLVSEIPESSKQIDDKGRYFFVVDQDLLTKFEREIEDPDDADVAEVAGSCGLSGGGCPIR